MPDAKTLPVAIQPDQLLVSDGRPQSYSDVWIGCLEEQGVPYKLVDVRSAGIIQELQNSGGFMWRFSVSADELALVRRIIPVVQSQVEIPIFPDLDTIWHYDDKVAQWYLMQALGIPMPSTWVVWQKEEAFSFVKEATFPLVLKLSGGASSKNVKLLEDPNEATEWVHLLFSSGLYQLEKPAGWRTESPLRRIRKAVMGYRTDRLPNPGKQWQLQKNYLLVQEFLPENDYDIRITVIGHRAFAYHRQNRPGDFRASGSGVFDTDRSKIDIDSVSLGYQVAKKLKMQTAAIDILWSTKNQRYEINEVSYTFVAWMVEACPGHWLFEGGNEDARQAQWVDGRLHPAVAIATDFVDELKRRTS